MSGATPDLPLIQVGIFKTGDQSAGPALRVTEDEMPCALVVIVHRLFDKSHAEDVAIEGHRAVEVLDEEGYVVDPRDPHPALVHLNPRPPERRLKSSRIA